MLIVIILILFLLVHAYFSGSETAYFTMNKLHIKTLADDGNKKAKKAMKISSDFERALVWLLVGNNVTNIALASITTVLFSDILEGSENVALVSTVLSTIVVFLFGEVIPKTIGQDRCDTISLNVSGSMLVCMKIFAPVISLFNGVIKFATKFFQKDEQPTITEEELIDIIDTIEEEGVIDEDQSDLFKSALDFSDKTAGDIMTMKSNLFAIDEKMSNSQILEYISKTNCSRLPVYRENIDNVVGVILIRNFLKEYAKNNNFKLKKIIREPFFVDVNSKIDDLLDTMRQHKIHMAIVGEKGKKTLGVVTIEDFLEELVGEIYDETDIVDNNFQSLGGNKYKISAKMRVSTAFEKLGLQIDDPKIAQKPIVSWIIETLGHFPEEEEMFLYKDILEVEASDIEDSQLSFVTIKRLDNLPEELENSASFEQNSFDGGKA